MIISDLAMEVAQGKLLLKLHCVWESKEQTNPSYAASQQLCVALLLSPACRNVTVSGGEF